MKMRNSPTNAGIARISQRRRSRGVAMVEAMIALPVILMFFGLMMFIEQRASNHIQLQTEAYRTAMSGALSGCEGDSPDLADEIKSMEVSGDGTRPIDTGEKNVGKDVTPHGMNKFGSYESGSLSRTVTLASYNKTLSSSLVVGCNDKQERDGNPFQRWLDYFGNTLKTQASW